MALMKGASLNEERGMAPHFTRNANDMSGYEPSGADRTTRIRGWLNRVCGSPGHRLVVPLHLQGALFAVLGGIPGIDAQTVLCFDPILVWLEAGMARGCSHSARLRWP